MTAYKSNNFQFWLNENRSQVQMTIQFPEDCWSTSALPSTTKFLKKHRPSVFNCQCFNENKHSFAHEVKNTELAHLFEHLVIDEMRNLKAKTYDAEFEGETAWDWHRHPIGSFKITFKLSQGDAKYFQPALIKSVQTLEKLICSCDKETL